MSAVPRDVRAFIFDRDGGHCRYCNIRLRRDDATVDHYIPTAHGGTNHRENLRLACNDCNQLKGSMPPTEWACLPGRTWHINGAKPDRIAMLARIAPRYRPQVELPESTDTPDIVSSREDTFSRRHCRKPGSNRGPR